MSDDDLYDEADADELSDLSHPPLTETEKLLNRLLDVVESAKSVPLSTSAMINKDEVVSLVEQTLDTFPRELRQSRWLLKERDDFLKKAQAEADEILGAARTRAGRMVERSELVKAAEARAAKITEEAEAQARRLRLEVEDYCDQKLGSFEIVLERTQRLVAQGRERLQLRSARFAEDPEVDPPAHLVDDSPADDDISGDVFDQDGR
jgi:cell division septum initiation protein DivIVA